MEKKEILVILDHNYANNNFNKIKKSIVKLFGERYEIVFKLFNPSMTNYEYDSELCQNIVDAESVYTSLLDYECVIICGDAAYFWLRSFYCKNMIVINPTLDIYKDFYDVDEKYYRDMHNLRDFNTENAICILSNENKDKRESYDNAFINTTVVISKENINDIDNFWSKNSTLEMVFNFLVE